MPVDLRTQTHEALRRAIEIDRDTLQIARETNDILAVQEDQIRQVAQTVEVIDHKMKRADKTAGEINSCCGFGFWHWLKRKLCCLDGEAVAIRESNAKDLRRAEARAHPTPIVLPSEPIYVPALVAEDSFDRELSILGHQVEELRQDALLKREELNLQNKMLDTAARQAAATDTHMARVSRYVNRID